MQTQPLQQQTMQFLPAAPKQLLSEWQVPAPQQPWIVILELIFLVLMYTLNSGQKV